MVVTKPIVVLIEMTMKTVSNAHEPLSWRTGN